jgi:hypothetical protein
VPHCRLVVRTIEYSDVLFAVNFEGVVFGWTPFPVPLYFDSECIASRVVALFDQYWSVELIVVVLIVLDRQIILLHLEVNDGVVVPSARQRNCRLKVTFDS